MPPSIIVPAKSDDWSLLVLPAKDLETEVHLRFIEYVISRVEPFEECELKPFGLAGPDWDLAVWNSAGWAAALQVGGEPGYVTLPNIENDVNELVVTWYTTYDEREYGIRAYLPEAGYLGIDATGAGCATLRGLLLENSKLAKLQRSLNKLVRIVYEFLSGFASLPMSVRLPDLWLQRETHLNERFKVMPLMSQTLMNMGIPPSFAPGPHGPGHYVWLAERSYDPVST